MSYQTLSPNSLDNSVFACAENSQVNSIDYVLTFNVRHFLRLALSTRDLHPVAQQCGQTLGIALRGIFDPYQITRSPRMPDKSVAEKLLIKPGQKVLLVNQPKGYRALLGELPKNVKVLKETAEAVDLIQVFVASRKELEEHLPGLKALLAPKGLLWVTYHKGTSKQKSDINRDSIAAYAKTVGLQAVAMISVDEDWSALRLKVV